MAPLTAKDISKMIDHSLLHPTMTDKDLEDGCRLAVKYDVASVCIKPYAVNMAASLLKGSDVLVSTVIGFPHGSNSTNIKVMETFEAVEAGAREIDMVVNIGKVLSEEWDYVKYEIESINEACMRSKAIVKVIFENDYLPDDKFKIRLCEICSEAGVAFVKTSSGYGFVKQADGSYNYKGATEHDLKLMRKHSAASVQIKAAGGVRSLEDLLKVREWGVTRIGATATAAIMEAFYGRIVENNISGY
jgi:deoxyribose-phosphate aldolase